MGNYFEEEEDDDQFFDSHSFYSDECCSSPDFGQVNGFSDNFHQYKFWSMFPESVDKRRHRFWT